MIVAVGVTVCASAVVTVTADVSVGMNNGVSVSAGLRQD